MPKSSVLILALLAVASLPSVHGSCQAPSGSFCCTDDTTNPNYVCPAGSSCGRGVCVPAGSTLCGSSGSNYCWAGTKCCGSTCCSTTQFCGGDENSCSCSSNAFPEPKASLKCGPAATLSDDDDDEPCFPSTAMVTLPDGALSKVEALKEGDSILATTSEGALITDQVSLLSIAKPGVAAPFLTLTAANNQSITLTAEHHVAVGKMCCSNVKKAKDIVLGETVWVHAKSVTLMPVSITKTQASQGVGLHSPVLANGGLPIVDGFVTAFDSMEKVTLAKYGLSPLLKACKATSTCSRFRGLFLGEDYKYIV